MIQINAIGDACPLPVIKTKKALSEMKSGQLVVLVDNEVAVQNIKRFAESSGHQFSYEHEDGKYRIIIDKAEESQNTNEVVGQTPLSGKVAVVLSSDTMGSGDDELGRILMKGFIFALTQLDTLPDTILLYNSGAHLSVKGSASLDDLIALEKAGTKIMTCGTCLNHFKLTEKLGVGEITNMYSIVEEMKNADKTLRP